MSFYNNEKGMFPARYELKLAMHTLVLVFKLLNSKIRSYFCCQFFTSLIRQLTF